jgi:hypothetical protein
MRLQEKWYRKNVNTLGNASINNDGAVPEPRMVIDYYWANDTFLLLQKTKKVELMYALLTEYKIGIWILQFALSL